MDNTVSEKIISMSVSNYGPIEIKEKLLFNHFRGNS